MFTYIKDNGPVCVIIAYILYGSTEMLTQKAVLAFPRICTDILTQKTKPLCFQKAITSSIIEPETMRIKLESITVVPNGL